MVTGKKADEISRNDDELKRLSMLVKDKKDETRACWPLGARERLLAARLTTTTMTTTEKAPRWSCALATPRPYAAAVAVRCMHAHACVEADAARWCWWRRTTDPIEATQEVIASGITRYHAACPTKEEAEKQLRPVRFFVKKFPDRLVVQLAVDAHTNYTFLYEVDRDALNDALRKKSHEAAKVVYVPDSHAHASSQRKLPDSPVFDIAFKDFAMELGFEDASTKKTAAKPRVSDGALVVTKYHLANGVLQRVDARFKVEGHLLSHVGVDVALEHWPPVKEDAVDPLTRLKAAMSDAGTGNVDLVAEAKAKTAAAVGHA